MAFSDVGTYCHYHLCGQHTYLPFECRSCDHNFCKLHIEPTYHECPERSICDIPLQNNHNPVPYNTCSYSKCTQKTAVSILCKECNQLYCIKHHYTDDHECNPMCFVDNELYDDDLYESIGDFDAHHNDSNSDNDVISNIDYNPNESIQAKHGSPSLDVEVIDAYKFSVFNNFGYTEKDIYNAWFCIKTADSTITPNSAQFVHKMLDQLAHEEDHMLHAQEHKQEQPHVEHKAFDVETTCVLLHNEIGYFSKTSIKLNTWLRIITTTNMMQRQVIKAYYKHKYFIHIDRYIQMNYKGIWKRLLLYSFQNEIERYSYLLRVCIKKTKDIGAVIQILCHLESDTIQSLVTYYDKSFFRKSLKSQISKLTVNNARLKQFLMKILDGKRAKASNMAMLYKDIFFLKSTLNQKDLTKKDEMRVMDIFSTKSFVYLRALCAEFKSLTDIPLLDVMDDVFGSYGFGYAVYCVLTFAMDTNAFYSELITKGIQNSGCKHILFWSIIIDRMDIDLHEILQCYTQSHIDKSHFEYFLDTKLRQQDESAAIFLSKICHI